jgi:hypothetical protein
MTATLTHPDYDVTPSFTNIVTTIGAIASTNVLIQNIGLNDIAIVVRASGSAPTDADGIILRPREGYEFNGAQVWVKCFGPSSKVSIATIT